MCLAVPGKLIEVWGEGLERSARVDFGGVLREISLAFILDAALGDYVLVHVGVAPARLNEAEARATLDALAWVGVVE